MKKLGGGELFWIIYKVKSFMHNANNNQTYFKNLAMFTRWSFLSIIYEKVNISSH